MSLIPVFFVSFGFLALSGCSFQDPSLSPPEKTNMKAKKQLRFASSKGNSSSKEYAPVVIAPFELAVPEKLAEVRDIHEVQEKQQSRPNLIVQEVSPIAERHETKESQVAEEIKEILKPPLHTGSQFWQWPSGSPVTKIFSLQTDAKKGIEIRGKQGDPVLAAAPGKVVYKGSGIRGYGELIILKHEKGFLSAYAHNQAILVEEGDQVHLGQMIAKMGAITTDTYGLHFEIRHNGTPVDPLKYLPKR